ncbi:1-acyl-sn-glycerol-3-phosphate acyltransferase [Algoriphagus namhaensis]
MPEKFIDVEKAIHSKNPKLLKWLPGFVLSYIKRVTHEKWINEVMEKIHMHQGADFVDAVIREFDMEIELVGAEYIPKEGGVVIASNHPLGAMDGVALMYAIARVRPDIRFLVNDLLMQFQNFQPYFVPVNKFGKNSSKAMQSIDEVYQKDFVVLIFPAGLVSRKGDDGKIRDLQWKKSFISKAKKYQKNVIPCFTSGNNSSFFYNLGRWRKKLGINANLEMFYLADEMYHQRGSKITITLGSPVPYTHFDGSKTEGQWADYMKDKVYKLVEQS